MAQARVVTAMPSLSWCLALQKRAARVGFEFQDANASATAVAEEARELAATTDQQAAFNEMGDLLFAMVALSRKLRVNPEDALRVAGQRFTDRFKNMESQVSENGAGFRELTPEQLEDLWSTTKPQPS